MKEIVHCTTQKEWDFVCKNSNWQFPTKSEWFRNYETNSYLTIDSGHYGDVRKKIKNYTLLSFDEWKIKYGFDVDLNEVNLDENYSYLIDFLKTKGIT